MSSRTWQDVAENVERKDEEGAVTAAHIRILRQSAGGAELREVSQLTTTSLNAATCQL